MIESGTNKYIESQHIRVFPCAYRGYYDEDNETSRVFDPEARATTESNYTNTFHKISSIKDTYVVSWDNGNGTNTVLKCVIGGYYFEIYNQPISDFFYEKDGSIYPYTLCIKVTEQSLASDPTYDGSRKTSVLGSFEINTAYLDVQKGGKYVFTGLSLLRTTTGAGVTAQLLPFKATKLADGSIKYDINPAAFSITTVLDTGNGKYSIRMIEDDTGEQFNTTIADGDYAIALGRHTEASALASTAIGDNTKATAEAAFAFIKESQATEKYAIAGGDGAIASAESAIALGANVKATSTNQIVLGTYNKEDPSQLFILANGTSARNTAANKFTVDYEGNVKALGGLEVAGNISARAAGQTNTLTLGSTATNTSGALKIYGTGATEVFNVSNTGATSLTGTLNITNETQSSTIADGAVNVAGGVGVKKNVNVGGNLAIGGNSTFAGTLEVAANKTTTLGGSLTAKNTTINGTLKVSGTNTATIGGGLTVGGDTTLTGSLTVADETTNSIGGKLTITDATEADATTAALNITGGTAIGKNLRVGNTVVINGTAKATSKDTGALIVKGGAGIDGDIYISGAVYSPKGVIITSGGAAITGDTSMEKLTVSGGTSISKDSESDSTTSGALVVTGGVGVGKNLNVGGNTAITGSLTVDATATIKGETAISATTDSVTTTTGALKVAGGVGIAKQLRVGEDTTLNGNISGAKNLTLSGNNTSTPNTLTLGSTSTSNKGGQLLIYGAGTTEVFEVANTGNTYIAGTLEIDGKLTTESAAEIGGKLTIDDQVEISKTGISGINSLSVDGKIEGHYFNATSYNTTSDLRKKCNIEDYTFNESILNLPIKQFEYRDDATHTKYIGCIAQDLQKICPEFVTETSDGTLTIQESKLIYALLQEVKTLKAKVDLLERR